MNFTLKILGTASAMPFSDRNPSAQALNVHGRCFLIDCGEGTQQQIRRFHLPFTKVEAIFISHIHGDHIFGLFGLLGTMGLFGRTAPLKIFGPRNLGPVLNFWKSWFSEGTKYEVEFVPLQMKTRETILEAGPVKVSAFPLNHKTECFGYRFDEVTEPSRNPRKPRSYAYCSDTAPFPEEAEYVRGVDVLYHEATYPAEFADKAAQYFHSTTLQAANCALEAGVGKLVIGHYSSRVKDLSVFARECRTVFPATVAADDGDEFEIGS